MPKDICDIVSPIFTMWKYTAFPVYKLQGKVGSSNRKFVVVKSYLVYLGLMVYTVPFWFYRKAIFTNELGKFRLNMESAEVIFQLLYDIGIILVCHTNRENIGNIPAKLMLNENMLYKISTDFHYHKEICRSILIFTFVKYGLVTAAFTAEYVGFPYNRLSKILYYSSWTFQFHSELVLIAYLLILRKQYQVFNRILNAQSLYCLAYVAIKGAIRTHSALNDSVDSIKKAFHSYIFLKVLSDLSLTATGIFRKLSLSFKLCGQHYVLWMCNVLYLALVLVVNFTIIIIFQSIIQEDKLTRRFIIENILTYNKKKNVAYKTATLVSILQYNNDKIRFMVCGFFPLNCTMTSGVVTYIVYLLQYYQ